jgi:hypothetical protein
LVGRFKGGEFIQPRGDLFSARLFQKKPYAQGVYIRTHKVRAETRALQSAVRTGTKRSVETRLKMSLALIGNQRGKGKAGYVMPESSKALLRASHLGKKLSEEHKTKIRLSAPRGQESPHWKGTTTEYEKARKCFEANQWRAKVFERDNYTCQHCGDNQGGNLNAHHIKPFIKFVELRYEVRNGITLCEECHRAEHRRIK